MRFTDYFHSSKLIGGKISGKITDYFHSNKLIGGKNFQAKKIMNGLVLLVVTKA